MAVYLNPLLAISQLITCLNREVIAHLVIYWLISVSAVLMVGGGSCCGCCSTATAVCSLQDRSKRATNDTGRRQRSSSRTRDQIQDSGGSAKSTSNRSNTQDTPDCIKEETSVQQPHQQQQQQSEEKSAKKSKQQEKQKQHEKGKKNNNKHTDNSQHDEDRQPMVVCGCDPYDAASCPQWTCTVNKSPSNDAANRSTNAQHDDDDDQRISSLLRAFTLSRMSDSAHDDGRQSTDVQNDPHADSDVVDNGYVLLRAGADEDRRWNDDDGGGTGDVLVVTRSSTREPGRSTASNSWAHYYEDRCSEYNDGDEDDQQPNYQT